MSLKNWITGKNKPSENTDNTDATFQATSSKVITLADIARSMQHAATAANQLITHQYKQILDHCFDEKADGVLSPKAIAIQLDSRHHIELPLIALSTPRGMMLEKMTIKMTVRADAVSQDEIASPLSDCSISNVHVSLSPSSKGKNSRNSQFIDVEMQLAAIEPPEGIMRLIDEYTNHILPKITEEEKNHG